MKTKVNKYRNKKVVVNNIEFDSVKEANRFYELRYMEMSGKIKNLERQVKFELIPSQKIDGKVVERPCNYIADFVYEENGKKVVEDVKGYRDPKSAGYAKFVIKRKMMLHKFGIQIREV